MKLGPHCADAGIGCDVVKRGAQQDDYMTLGGVTAIRMENVLPLGSQFLGNELQLKINPCHSTLSGFLPHNLPLSHEPPMISSVLWDNEARGPSPEPAGLL